MKKEAVLYEKIKKIGTSMISNVKGEMERGKPNLLTNDSIHYHPPPFLAYARKLWGACLSLIGYTPYLTPNRIFPSKVIIILLIDMISCFATIKGMID